MEGDTYNIIVSRDNVFESMINKLSATMNDPHLPLKVDLYYYY